MYAFSKKHKYFQFKISLSIEQIRDIKFTQKSQQIEQIFFFPSQKRIYCFYNISFRDQPIDFKSNQPQREKNITVTTTTIDGKTSREFNGQHFG